MFVETSAKVGHNVKVLFRKIAMALPGMDDGAANENRGQSKLFTYEFGKEKNED